VVFLVIKKKRGGDIRSFWRLWDDVYKNGG